MPVVLANANGRKVTSVAGLSDAGVALDSTGNLDSKSGGTGRGPVVVKAPVAYVG
jgi:hypothetical protein